MINLVDLDSISFVSTIKEEFGLPTIKHELREELVGPYSLDGSKGFLKYDVPHRAWFYIKEASRDWTSLMTMDDLSEEDRKQLWAAMEIAARSAPRKLPYDLSEPTDDFPFVFEGWKLMWIFVPALRRWELAPLGRA